MRAVRSWRSTRQNPQKLVAVWVDNDPAMLGITNNVIAVVIEGAYSINGGQVWHPLLGEPANGQGIPVSTELLDPATSGPTVAYKYATDPSVGFDASGNFYMLAAYHNATDVASSVQRRAGPAEVRLHREHPEPGRVLGRPDAPNLQRRVRFGSADLKVLYQWNSTSNDTVTDPTMQVDDNLPTFTDPATGQVQTDPYSGNVYVSWTSIDVKPSLAERRDVQPEPDQADRLVRRREQLQPARRSPTSTARHPDDGNGPTTRARPTPALTVSQGRPASESGQNGDAGRPRRARSRSPGMISPTASSWPTRSRRARVMSSAAAPHGDQRSPSGPPRISTMTVQFPAGFDFSTLTNLDVTVAIVDASDANLGLTLIAPSGDRSRCSSTRPRRSAARPIPASGSAAPTSG